VGWREKMGKLKRKREIFNNKLILRIDIAKSSWVGLLIFKYFDWRISRGS